MITFDLTSPGNLIQYSKQSINWVNVFFSLVYAKHLSYVIAHVKRTEAHGNGL